MQEVDSIIVDKNIPQQQEDDGSWLFEELDKKLLKIISNVGKKPYIMVRFPEYKPDKKSPYVLYHRLIFEDEYDCCLLDWGIIHHRDKNRSNNVWYNLQGMTRRQHMKLHQEDIRHGKTLNWLYSIGKGMVKDAEVIPVETSTSDKEEEQTITISESFHHIIKQRMHYGSFQIKVKNGQVVKVL